MSFDFISKKFEPKKSDRAPEVPKRLRGTVAVEGFPELNTPPLVTEEFTTECPRCYGAGWECYEIGIHGPHYRECEECYNPDNLRFP